MGHRGVFGCLRGWFCNLGARIRCFLTRDRGFDGPGALGSGAWERVACMILERVRVNGTSTMEQPNGNGAVFEQARME